MYHSIYLPHFNDIRLDRFFHFSIAAFLEIVIFLCHHYGFQVIFPYRCSFFVCLGKLFKLNITLRELIRFLWLVTGNAHLQSALVFGVRKKLRITSFPDQYR